MSNDAKGCYDRIAHVVLDIAMRRLGCPRPALQSMLETIQEMEHHIRTGFGDSEQCYGNDPTELPPQGVLQGNGAGPASWSCISSILIDTVRKEGFGFEAWSLIRQRAIAIACFAFVDDTDLIHANNDPDVDTPTLIREAQDALLLWEDLIRVTGGELAPHKSYWYLVEVIWKNGRWTYATEDDISGDLWLGKGTKEEPLTLIDRLEVNAPKEALGIQVCPNGDLTEEKEEYLLKKKIKVWADAIRTRKIKRAEAWYCFKSTIMKTIEYPLTATNFSREDVDDIMRPLLKVILPLCGIQKIIPRKLLYGPVEERGLGLKDPYWLQLIHHLQAILRHSERDTPSRDLLNENMELVQAYVGSDQPFWELPFEVYGHLAPRGWIKDTWQALSESGLTLKGQDITVKPKRANDVHLMDAFVDQEYDEQLLATLNKCRMYYGADTLADISTACGSRIDQQVWEGRPMTSRKRKNWIQTRKPTKNEWEKWRDALRQTFMQPHCQTRLLNANLGEWINEDARDWIWWKDTHTDSLYQQTELGWKKWSRRPAAGAVANYHLPEDTMDVPSGKLRASVHNYGTVASVLSTGPVQPTTPDPLIHSLSDAVHHLPLHARWSVRNLTHTDNGASVAHAIQTNQAVAVGDGSLKAQFGTSAFVIEGQDSQHRIRAVNVAPGPLRDGDSHRCEMAGLYGIVNTVNCIASLHNVQSGSITVACDNKQAIRMFNEDFIPDPKHSDFDLVLATWNLIQQSPIEWEGVHRLFRRSW